MNGLDARLPVSSSFEGAEVEAKVEVKIDLFLRVVGRCRYGNVENLTRLQTQSLAMFGLSDFKLEGRPVDENAEVKVTPLELAIAKLTPFRKFDHRAFADAHYQDIPVYEVL